MINRIKSINVKRKSNYESKTFVNSFVSFFITILFAIYNGFLGIFYSAVWNGSICIYYLFLVVIRGIIIKSERKCCSNKNNYREKVHFLTSIILLLMNISLFVPVSLMVLNKKEVNMTIIPAITVALYTTIKVVIASINLKRMKKTSNILVVELRYINFIDGLVSILTLQNTLIAVNGESDRFEMLLLSAISSACILLFIIVITFLNFRKRKTSTK